MNSFYLRTLARSIYLFTLLYCGSLVLQAEQNVPPWENPVDVGRALYRENCIVCHEIEEKETQKLGPSLFRLFQNETLPFSGGKPNIAYVKIKIQFGGDVMPPYVNRLTLEEINKIIHYIKTKY